MSRSAAKVRQARNDLLAIGLALLLIHAAAIAQFTKGFLLTRPVRTETNAARTPDPPFKRAAVLVVDALRYDFINSAEFPTNEISQDPRHTFTAQFWADAPTTTLQRLKGLTTGSLPAFIDAGSNFGGSLIDEDNWVLQASNNGPVAFVGDDTWTALFSNFSLSYPFPSLNVRDLHTVDNGVKHVMPQLYANKSNSVVIGHMLGVDHAGHRYGPDHPEMKLKLKSTFEFVRNFAENLDNETVFIVMGDHGMDSTGNHGGDSLDELRAGIFVYSKKPAFSEPLVSPMSMRQTDFVPTFSAWLGLPIPFSSLGFPVRAAFDSETYDFAALEALVKQQLQTYAAAIGVETPSLKLSANANANAKSESEPTVAHIHAELLDTLQQTWIEFDLKSMAKGCFLMFGALFYSCRLSPAPQRANRSAALLPYGMTVGFFCGICYVSGTSWKFWADVAFFVACGALVGAFSLPRRSIFTSKWSYFAMLILFAETGMALSNSFVIWEQSILHYLSVTVVIVLLLGCLHTSSKLVAVFAIKLAVGLLIALRFGLYISVCREETAQWCLSTFYLPNSSMFSLYYLFLLTLATVLLLPLIKPFFVVSENYVGVAPLILDFTAAALMFGIFFWSLEAADTRGLLTDVVGVHTVRILISRSLLVLGVGFGIYIWWKNLPLVQVVLSKTGKIERLAGLANIYGSYAILPMFCVFWCLIPANKPPAILALMALIYSIFSFLDLVDLGGAKETLLPPVIFDMLAYSAFFSTGHQATIPSVQWDIAFSASATVSPFWSPITLILNQFGPFLLCAFPATLFRLWRRTPFKEPVKAEMLIGTAMAHTTFVAGVHTLASMIAAFMLRRHLMAWKIFAPRFILAGLALIVTDITGFAAIIMCSVSVQKVTAFFNKND